MAKTKQTIVEAENDIGPGPITPAQDVLIAAAIELKRRSNLSDDELSRMVTKIRQEED